MTFDSLDEDAFINDYEIVFLTVDQIITLHEDSIGRYSPTESRRIRDVGLLESATMNPQQTFDGNYLYSTIPKMATAYLVGLALNHPFENGNKRVAFAACSIFLRMNGYKLTLSQDEAANLTLDVVNHEVTSNTVEAILETAIVPM